MNIFPESSLAISLITTVWVGLFVICFFNLRFGWTLSGLIVPGYLAPLIILKPWSALAVIIEAIITYLAVKGFSVFGERTKLYSELFGRDRFFFILLLSVAVRLFFDAVFFPWFSSVLNEYLGIEFLFRDGLYSIGLVIVALTANQFWTSGLKRGVFQLVVTLTITLLVVKYILIGLTNFRLNELANIYENIATSILASPKAYIILLTTAFIAARLNLHYGWEFSGIAIPALLALLWHNPFEIVVSIVEALMIYLIASLLLRTKFFSKMAVEGARKILFFFNISFFYKLALGFILPLFFVNIQVTDYFGFGYMLTSLIAIKMYEKKAASRIIGSTVMTSFIAVIVSVIIGFSLTLITKHYSQETSKTASKQDIIKTSRISANMPLKYKTSKPLLLGNSDFGLIETKYKNRKLNISELKFIDENILLPLLYLTDLKTQNLSDLEISLNNIARTADVPGIKMTLFGKEAFRPEIVELKGSVDSGSMFTYYLNISEAKNILLECDCASREALILCRLLNNELKPKALILNAIFSRSYDGSIECDTVEGYLKASLFDLCNQVSIRELEKNKEGLNMIYVKTAPKKNKLDSKTIYIATNVGSYSMETLNKNQAEIAAMLAGKGYKIRFVSGSRETTGLETNNLLAARYLDMTSNSSLMVLWVSR